MSALPTPLPVPAETSPKAARLASLRARLGRMAAVPGREQGADTGPIPDPGPWLGEAVPASYLDTPAAFAFLAALAARAAARRPGPVLLCVCQRAFDFGLPNPAALAAAGLPATRIVLVRSPDAKGALWALEEGARTRGVAASVAACLPDRAYGLLPSRRLTLAAQKSGTPVFVLRAAGARNPSAALHRWRVESAPGAPAPFLGAAGLPGLAARRWRIRPEKTPGASVCFEVEWNETALRFDPPAALVRGPAVAGRGESAIRAA